MHVVAKSPTVCFEYAYANYASCLYGMILQVIQLPAACDKMLEEVFTGIDYNKLNKKNASATLVCKTRGLINQYIKDHPDQFKSHHPHITNGCEISCDQLLELVYSGRYTILQIQQITGNDETLLKQRLVVAVRNCVNKNNNIIKAV